MKRTICLLLLACSVVGVMAQKVCYTTDRTTGGVSAITIEGDKYGMNWILKPDGSQYAWVDSSYCWGLGYFTINDGRRSKKVEWNKPYKNIGDGQSVSYFADNIDVSVRRSYEGDILVEDYTFTNKGSRTAYLSDVGIYTPLNDNYPSADVCITNRTDAHIWDGDNGAWINALRMGGGAPHLGLVVTDGSIKSYEIWERDLNHSYSNFRGVISLDLPDMALKQGESYHLQWKIFSHKGNADFKEKLLALGGIWTEANKYVYEKGETATVSFISNKELTDCYAQIDGASVAVQHKGNVWMVDVPLCQEGDARVTFFYDRGKQTHADLHVVSSYENLLKKRVDFIRTHQQMKNVADPRYGAYMVYDNVGDSIFLNDTPNVSHADRDDGGERLGMGVLLAKQYLLTHDVKLLSSLKDYAKFLREKLQTKDFVTYSTAVHKARNRGYDYAWVAKFYFLMYNVTGEKQYAQYGYQTLQALFRQFGYGFYCIELPVRLGLQSLQKAGMKKEYKKLLADYKKTGDIFVANSVNYPKSEVNFEQSIVAPAVDYLCQMFLETGIQKYLDEAKKQMPVVEAFDGQQPSFHLNEIGNRHWDGYWFGKREMWGDTFPHYWSAITASAFYHYSLCTGDTSYVDKAKRIVQNNLCLFFEDGKASCAYLYPYKVNGVKAQFYDEYANDQDWALVFYLLVYHNV